MVAIGWENGPYCDHRHGINAGVRWRHTIAPIREVSSYAIQEIN